MLDLGMREGLHLGCKTGALSNPWWAAMHGFYVVLSPGDAVFDQPVLSMSIWAIPTTVGTWVENETLKD